MRRILLLLLLLLVVLAVAGCGGGGSALSFDPAASASTTSDAGSAKVAFDTTVTAGGQNLHMTGDGAVDFDRRAATMTFDVGDLLRASGLPARAGERWKILTNGLVVYMHAPTLSRQVPGGKEWLKLDVEQLAKSRNVDLGQFQQLTQNDPTQMLDYLKAVSGKIDEVGNENVRGVATTHYRGKVDLDKVADQAPANVRETFRTSIRSLERRLGTHEVPVDVWVDSDNRVRRFSEHLPVAMGGNVDFAVDFFDFGTPVSVTTPPASDTMDLGSLLGG
jgi:predicted small lipoprotein YifL